MNRPLYRPIDVFPIMSGLCQHWFKLTAGISIAAAPSQRHRHSQHFLEHGLFQVTDRRILDGQIVIRATVLSQDGKKVVPLTALLKFHLKPLLSERLLKVLEPLRQGSIHLSRSISVDERLSQAAHKSLANTVILNLANLTPQHWCQLAVIVAQMTPASCGQPVNVTGTSASRWNRLTFDESVSEQTSQSQTDGCRCHP